MKRPPIGIVRNLVTGNGNWVVPRLAGEAALDTPPLVYLVAAGFAKLFSWLLPLHDAARLASGAFMALTFWFTALTAKELYGRDYAGIAAIGLLGCVGWIVRAHQLIPDVPLLTGISLGLYGLAVAPRRPLLGGGGPRHRHRHRLSRPRAGCTDVLVAIALILAVMSRRWRQRGTRRDPRRRVRGGCAVARRLAFRSLPAVARALPPVADPGPHRRAALTGCGATHLGVAQYLVLLPWFAWPVLPLAIWTALARPPRPARSGRTSQLPLIALVVMFALLGLVSNAGDVYALPLLLPLTLLAVASLDTLRRGAISALDWFGIMTFGLIAILLWIAWVALLTGWPAGIARELAAFQPGFEGRFHWLPFLVAAVSTLLWAALVARTMPTTRRALVNWGGGITLMWILASTLWLPYVDAGKSYRGVVRELERALPKGSRCISSIGLGDSQRAMLEYYAGIVTHREEIPQPKRECDLLLTQGTGDAGARRRQRLEEDLGRRPAG